MKLKTYAAKNLKEALGQVKKELGPEAVILSTRKRWIKEGTLGLHRHPGVEVTAAADPGAQFTQKSPKQRHVDGDLESVRYQSDLHQDSTKPAFTSHPFGKDSYPASWHAELQELKNLVLQLVRLSGPPAWLLQYPELAIFFRFLLKTGVDDKFLNHWLEHIKSKVAHLKDNGRNWREIALRPLMSAFEVLDPMADSPEGMQVWTFIGPTGVGKTTTLAKLAAHYAFWEKKTVGLITLDNHRLGAQSQIEAYARIMGIPLIGASQQQELISALEKFRDRHLVLIDTAGRSPKHPEQLSELCKLFNGLAGVHHHLVLSATAQDGDLVNALTNFSVLPITSCVVTKVDEASDFSGVFNLLCRFRTPISYLTTGQRVPEDLELASKRRVAELLLHSATGSNFACQPPGQSLEEKRDAKRDSVQPEPVSCCGL